MLDTRTDGMLEQKIYVNGVLTAERVSEEPYRYVSLGRMWLCFTCVGDRDTLTSMDLDEVRIYSRPLTAEEIAVQYQGQ